MPHSLIKEKPTNISLRKPLGNRKAHRRHSEGSFSTTRSKTFSLAFKKYLERAREKVSSYFIFEITFLNKKALVKDEGKNLEWKAEKNDV